MSAALDIARSFRSDLVRKVALENSYILDDWEDGRRSGLEEGLEWVDKIVSALEILEEKE